MSSHRAGGMLRNIAACIDGSHAASTADILPMYMLLFVASLLPANDAAAPPMAISKQVYVTTVEVPVSSNVTLSEAAVVR
jgi:hypothetical protein